tara:strand:+ start:299 stop:1324 length:1026 start_codon:yes stop_codon:yes gene_type:complete
MKVSVWATKCHHCGEELGRPRREEAKLTLKDLGGTQQTSYAPSGNVTSALESFRVDEVAAEASRAASKPQSLWGRVSGKKQPLAEPTKSSVDDLPELDAYGKNLAASLLDDSPSMNSSRARSTNYATPSLVERVVKLVVVLVVLVVVYFGGSFAWTTVSEYIESQNRPPEIQYVNMAPEMMARGEQSIDVFEEAMKAFKIKNTEENKEIADNVRMLVLNDVDALMTANPWKSENHDKAYAIIQRAVNVDGAGPVAEKFAQVNDDVALYKFVLKSVDSTGTQATFRLNHPKFEPEATVELADRLLDRFIVQRISSRNVDLLDDKVAGRKLTISVNEGVKSRY